MGRASRRKAEKWREQFRGTGMDFEPHYERCPKCGNGYWKDEYWKNQCLPCWFEAKKQQQASGGGKSYQEKFNDTFHKNSPPPPPPPRTTTVKGLDDTMVRRLLQLCHPDKHAGSAASTIATQWLLDLKRRMES